VSQIVPLHVALPDVAADFATVLDTAARPRLAVLDGAEDAAVVSELPDAAEWTEDDGSEQVLLLVGGSVTALTARSSEPDELAVECASALQTFVMDERNAAWPVFRGDGRVAEPAVWDGVPQWVAAGRAVAFGRLSSALAG